MKRSKTRIAGSLLLVMISLVLASMACYSGQIPGVFELTPYHTPTPMPLAEGSRFSVLEEVLAPQESGRAFFNLTVDPEPLDDSLINSKSSCEGNSPAQVLYAAQDDDGSVFYLVDCVGSVGWVEEKRLAGPLYFAKGDLALTRLAEGATAVELLDDFFNPLPFNPLQTCQPETIVKVNELQTLELDDGSKGVVYNIECPTTGGALRGWVDAGALFGPLEVNVEDRALAFSSVDAVEGEPYALASEAAPLSDENAVMGDCVEGSIMETQEAMLAGDEVYFHMVCEDINGWTTQDRFVGPLLFDEGDHVVIYVKPVQTFLDQLTDEQMSSVTTYVASEEEADDAAEDTAAEGDELAANERQVVEYVPPLYLADEPGLEIVASEDSHAVGQCESNSLAELNMLIAIDQIYFNLSCDECVSTETDADGVVTCTGYETRTGWAAQSYLQGPIDFVPGDQVVFKSSSAALETDEDDNSWARLPMTLTGAASIGRFTQFSGRCPADTVLTVNDVVLEKSRTAEKYTFYYGVECSGEPASYTEMEDDSGVLRPVVSYEAGAEEPLSGYVLAKEIEPAEE